MPKPIATDQTQCFDPDGKAIPCQRTGQDGETRTGAPWPEPRFTDQGQGVLDNLTGLMWTKDANPEEFPLSWDEALAAVEAMNRDQAHGYSDWRLPTRPQLFSLISHTEINPALPKGHPFENVFAGYYWTSDSCARFLNQAWYVHLGGARVFSGMKHGSYMVWPVREDEPGSGRKTDPSADRFITHENWAEDSLTGLGWMQTSSLPAKPVSWPQALHIVRKLNEDKALGFNDWRLPNIRELDSLIDLTAHTPALSPGRPFPHVELGYWSSTTSVYDPSYAWVLYTRDGRIGVGFKTGEDFFAWPVRSLQTFL